MPGVCGLRKHTVSCYLQFIQANNCSHLENCDGIPIVMFSSFYYVDFLMSTMQKENAISVIVQTHGVKNNVESHFMSAKFYASTSYKTSATSYHVENNSSNILRKRSFQLSSLNY